TLKELTAGIDKDRDMVLMSLGWLAREGHVMVERTDDHRISLRN
ncbi:MAG: winged helix-turn-helix domain-containing protein, partial [Candidatus Omnitrophica bacterium]|nr:winged helix-turn-helix domain-containing protein [Candidatus Omnitrophota bacterium]